MCYIFNVSRSGYYAWLNRPVSNRKQKNKQLGDNITHIYIKHKGKYGCPRITKELNKTGLSCGKNRVYNLMNKLKLKAKNKRKFKATTDSNHNLPIYENIINRDFTATAINQKWFSDISYIETNEGWLYLAVIIDVYSRAIIGWSMSENIDKKLVCNALTMALWRRQFPKGVILHSDRGSQYCSKEYQNMLKNNQFICSMSRKGNCWDNAIAETFFHTLKTELVYDHKYKTREEAKNSIFNYI
jgi:transposase InsO family protein